MFWKALKLQRLLGRVGRFALYNILAIFVAIAFISMLSTQGVLSNILKPALPNSNLADNQTGQRINEPGDQPEPFSSAATEESSGGAFFDTKVVTPLSEEEPEEGEEPKHQLSISVLRNARPIEMIAERQALPFPTLRLAPSERKPLEDALNTFLPEWETFFAGGSNEYRRRLAPLSSKTSVADRLYKRYDSHQPTNIGTCRACDTGSSWTGQLTASDLMVVRAYEADKFAFVTTQGIVSYTGYGSLSGVRFRRTYSVVFVKRADRWVVERAAADTLGRV